MKKLYNDLNKEADIFYCYSVNLYRFLKNNSLRYEEKFVTKEGKTCWKYKRTDVFEEVYKQFSLLKKEWKNEDNGDDEF